jgi:hypothetical protein
VRANFKQCQLRVNSSPPVAQPCDRQASLRAAQCVSAAVSCAAGRCVTLAHSMSDAIARRPCMGILTSNSSIHSFRLDGTPTQLAVHKKVRVCGGGGYKACSCSILYLCWDILHCTAPYGIVLYWNVLLLGVL